MLHLHIEIMLTAWNFLGKTSTAEYSTLNRNEYRTNTTAIQGNLLDNLPFGIGNEIGRAGRQVYETLKKNLFYWANNGRTCVPERRSTRP